MAVYTNYLTPTSFKPPPHGKGALVYRVKTLGGYTNAAALDTAINNFLDSLSIDGQPWPHLVSIEHSVYPKAENPDKDAPLHFSQLVYILVSP